MTHVELQHITIGYGHRVLLEDVSAAIGGGRLVALLGRNGTGKSTLLRAVAGLEAVVDRALNLVGMGGFADKPMDRLSDGEAQRVMIARALAQDTPVILLDEPTAFLDMPNRYELCTLLRRLAHDEGKCIFFSTHELDIALTLCDAVALIDPPRLHLLPTDEMIRSGHIERLFAGAGISFDPATLTIRLAKK